MNISVCQMTRGRNRSDAYDESTVTGFERVDSRYTLRSVPGGSSSLISFQLVDANDEADHALWEIGECKIIPSREKRKAQ